jgi:hypothetical protein
MRLRPVGVTDVQKVPTAEVWQPDVKHFPPAGWGYNSCADREVLTARIGEYRVALFNQFVSSAEGTIERETSAVPICEGFQNNPQKVLLKGAEAVATYNWMKSAEKPE